jgi:hypothetical protein
MMVLTINIAQGGLKMEQNNSMGCVVGIAVLIIGVISLIFAPGFGWIMIVFGLIITFWPCSCGNSIGQGRDRNQGGRRDFQER